MQSVCFFKERKPLFLGLSCLPHHDKANHLTQTEAREQAQCSCQRGLEKKGGGKKSFSCAFPSVSNALPHPLPLEIATQLTDLQRHLLQSFKVTVLYYLFSRKQGVLSITCRSDDFIFTGDSPFVTLKSVSHIRLEVSQGQGFSTLPVRVIISI